MDPMSEGKQRASAAGQPGAVEGRGDGVEARLVQEVRLRGEISCSKDLYIDGEVEGKIELGRNSLTVGPHGKVEAEVTAGSITILGRLQGKVRVAEKMEIRQGASVEGELVASHIVIEAGAVFRGTMDIVGPSEDPMALGGKRKSVASEPAAPLAPKGSS